MSFRSLSVAIVVGLLLSVCPPTPRSALAATITVTTNVDEVTTNGQCSLREAIGNANFSTRPFPDCAAGSGNDTIFLPADVITLAIPGRGEDSGLTGDLDILRTLTIQGQGADFSRILGGANAAVAVDRLFQVRNNASLTLRRVGVGFGNPLTGASGSAARGGAILVEPDAALVLEDAEVFESFARFGGGISSQGGAVTLTRTTVTGNLATSDGGGIFARDGTVTVQFSTLRNNDGGNSGGGMVSSGSTVTIFNSTISTNRTSQNSAGLGLGGSDTVTPTVVITGSTVSGNFIDPSLRGATDGFGAGVVLAQVSGTIVNSTISGNRFVNAVSGGGGGLRVIGGSVNLVHSTVAFNQSNGNGGGGLNMNPATDIVVRGTIVAQNTNASAPGTIDNCNSVDVAVSESNLTNSPPGNDDCGFGAASDLLDVNPRLGPLQDNGGPTFTHALGIRSQAVDHIQSFLLAGRGRLCTTFQSAGLQTFVDQRGSARGADGDGDGTTRCDIGAFEKEGSGTGITDFSPASANPAVNETVAFSFPWEVPSPKNWHDLARLELRFRDAAGTAFHIRWNEAGDTFQLVNPDGSLGPASPGGSNQTLQTPFASLNLANVRTQGSGPTGPLVTLTLPIAFTEKALGRTLTVEALAVEDAGAQQGFDPVGTVTVGAVAVVVNDPNNDKDGKSDKDQPARLTEERRQQRERTNRAGLDDYRTEGNAIASRCDLAPPEVDIANRDGTVTLVLLGDTAAQCRSVDPGEYVEADGEKLHEHRYEVDSLTVRNR